jgi:hypothetical protein
VGEITPELSSLPLNECTIVVMPGKKTLNMEMKLCLEHSNITTRY